MSKLNLTKFIHIYRFQATNEQNNSYYIYILFPSGYKNL